MKTENGCNEGSKSANRDSELLLSKHESLF
jgi:hypothetical protein